MFPLFVLTLVGSVTSGPITTDDTLRVLSYNIHGLLEDDRPEWDSQRLEWLVDAILSVSPDLVGLQEVLQTRDSAGTDNQAKTVAAELTRRSGRHWHAVTQATHISWDRYQEGLAILTPHLVLSSTRFLLETKDVHQRGLLGARVETPVGAVDFFTTHLAYRTQAEDVRFEQASEIKRHIAQRKDPDTPAIVVGDFNATPASRSIDFVTATTSDSLGGFWDIYARTRPTSEGATFPASDPKRRIDYVFLAHSGSLKATKSKVVFDEPRTESYLSDHLGVYAEFVTEAD